MSQNPFNVQVSAKDRVALAKQADSLGFLTANQWAGVVLRSIAKVTPNRALVALARINAASKQRGRVADR